MSAFIAETKETITLFSKVQYLPTGGISGIWVMVTFLGQKIYQRPPSRWYLSITQGACVLELEVLGFDSNSTSQSIKCGSNTSASQRRNSSLCELEVIGCDQGQSALQSLLWSWQEVAGAMLPISKVDFSTDTIDMACQKGSGQLQYRSWVLLSSSEEFHKPHAARAIDNPTLLSLSSDWLG